MTVSWWLAPGWLQNCKVNPRTPASYLRKLSTKKSILITFSWVKLFICYWSEKQWTLTKSLISEEQQWGEHGYQCCCWWMTSSKMLRFLRLPSSTGSSSGAVSSSVSWWASQLTFDTLSSCLEITTDDIRYWCPIAMQAPRSQDKGRYHVYYKLHVTFTGDTFFDSFLDAMSWWSV